MFNKEEYWKNRKEGKRGQGESPITARFLTTVAKSTKPVSKKAIKKNTKRARAVL